MKQSLLVAVCMAICMAGCGKTVLSSGNEPTPEAETESEAFLEPAADTETQKDEETDVAQDKPERIVCWGDSLTYGQGGNGVTFPGVLEEKLKLKVINYGIQGETAKQIGIRMGVFPMTVGSVELPAEAAPVQVSLSYMGEDPVMMRLGDCGINPCSIAGVTGALSYDASDGNYYFTRTEEGNAVSVAEGTQVETFASADKNESDIVVLFAGTNRPPNIDTVGELIETEKRMLQYLGASRYVVIGLTSLELVLDVEPINEALGAEFGEHFLDIRKYLLEQGLFDAGIAPTKQDEKDLAAGEIPSSLRVDEVHGNEAFYRIIGEQVLKKLEELHYIAQEDLK